MRIASWSSLKKKNLMRTDWNFILTWLDLNFDLTWKILRHDLTWLDLEFFSISDDLTWFDLRFLKNDLTWLESKNRWLAHLWFLVTVRALVIAKISDQTASNSWICSLVSFCQYNYNTFIFVLLTLYIYFLLIFQ